MTPKPSDRVTFEAIPVVEDGSRLVRVPAYGYLDRIEIRLVRPIPNMDSSRYLSFEFRLVADGQPVGWTPVFGYLQAEP